MSGYTQVSSEEGTFHKEQSQQIGNVTFVQNQNVSRVSQYQVYKTRWFMLYLQIICAACMSAQFLEFSIIADSMVRFYGITYEAVNWSSMLFLLIYIPTIFPIMHIADQISMRASLLITMVGTCAAAWIKVGSVASDRYWVVLLGQVVVCTTQGFVMVIPSRFAAAWFGKKQIALACGLGVFGIQLGSAIGCVLPATIVKPSNNANEVAYDLYVLNIGYAVKNTIALLLILIFFKSKPPTPPSTAEEQMGKAFKLGLKESTIRLFSSKSYVLLIIAGGINIGIFYAIPTMLNQILFEYFENISDDAGRIGLLMLVTGMLGATACGYVLDKFERFKLTTVLILGFHLLGMVAFTLSLYHSVAAVYVAATILGFFMTASYSLCIEVAAELTYPVPETTSSGYLLTSAQVIGIGLIYLYSFILYKYGALWANLATCAELLLATIMAFCIKYKLRRRNADEVQIKIEQKT